ncbi:MAG: AmmeMemoRadiSam system protein A [Armatimonadota bacterium]
MMFTPDQHQALLSLARQSVVTAVTKYRLEIPENAEEAFRQSLGAFVTLTRHERLRGCIGYPEPIFPLHEAIARAGAAAALQDPRFPAVTSEELKELSIEISVLSPLQEIKAEEVVVGTHGLVIEKGTARGLLLPQVPLEWGWNREEFLAQTCRKAGLRPDAWQHGARLYAFTAEVFSEKESITAPTE